MKSKITIIFFWLSLINYAQESFSLDDSKVFQDKLNEHYTNPETSILTEEDFLNFIGLDFFELSEDFIVKATFTHMPGEEEFEMPTTTDRLPVYVKYASLDFIINDTEYRLYAYQNIDLSKQEGYEDYLFIPYYDLTNGIETYGGGRYLDIRIPEGNEVFIDFNKSYNPYCVYNPKYSCPIPPAENDLEIEIRSGVKDWNAYLD